LRTFLVNPKNIKRGKVHINGDEFHHAVSVTKIRNGEMIRGIDGRGKEYLLRVAEINHRKRTLFAEILEERTSSIDSPYEIFLAFGLVKGARIDYLIEKATEVGVAGFIPLLTTRSVVRHLEKKERWIKIALSAVKQSGRAKIPEILDPVSFEEVLSMRNRFEQGLIASLSAEKSLRDLVLKDSILLLIGPEGGFTPEELKRAQENGFEPFSLGPRTLRTETASIAALSAIYLRKGEW